MARSSDGCAACSASSSGRKEYLVLLEELAPAALAASELTRERERGETKQQWPWTLSLVREARFVSRRGGPSLVLTGLLLCWRSLSLRHLVSLSSSAPTARWLYPGRQRRSSKPWPERIIPVVILKKRRGELNKGRPVSDKFPSTTYASLQNIL